LRAGINEHDAYFSVQGRGTLDGQVHSCRGFFNPTRGARQQRDVLIWERERGQVGKGSGSPGVKGRGEKKRTNHVRGVGTEHDDAHGP
jgi:hypothetical protein